MLKNNILIFGYGYCAKALIKKLKKHSTKIFVVSRNKSNINKLEKGGLSGKPLEKKI